jgi:DNA-directed RNA polymerase specialized sigma24 family protein
MQAVTVAPFAPSTKTRAAHATLYRTHAAELRSLARSVLGYEADAGDAVQEAFTNAWTLATERPALSPPPLGWLRDEVRRIAIAMRHRRTREKLMPLRGW